MAGTVISNSAAALVQSEIRRSWYFKSMQSERVKVFVGTSKETFKVAYELLAQYSTSFKKLLNPLDDSGDEITLPDVTKSTFEDFFIWVNAFEPTILHTQSHNSEHVDRALNLAVFAQRYHIYHLRNQASDVVRTALQEGEWNITPDMVSAVYKVAPAGSALRHLSFQGFVVAKDRNDSTIWQGAFKECPDLGWDFFQYNSGSELYTQGIELGGACRFHDHSDIIRGWQREDVLDCPYPHGAPRLMPEEVVSTSASVPVVHDVIVENGVGQSEVMPASLPLSSVEEAAGPEPMETQRTEPSVVESSADNWAPSETTETELVEPEVGKFEPHEEPLLEETPVESWVSQTNEAEPVDVASSVAEEEVSHVTVGNARMAVDVEVPVLSKVTLKRISVAEETPVEKEEPVVEEVSVAETTPVVEEADPVKEVTAPLEAMTMMERSNSVMSVDPQSTMSKSQKKRSKKARKQSLAPVN